MDQPVSPPSFSPGNHARELLARANAALLRGPNEVIASAQAACREAILLLRRDPTSTEAEIASVFVVLGQLHEREETPTSLAVAVGSYDEAIAIFRAASARAGAAAPPQRGHALALMNRGNALQKQESAEAWEESVRAYEQAIALLKQETLEDEGRISLGAAWMNLGAVLQRQASTEALHRAVAAQNEAAKVFRTLPLASDVHARRSLAAACMNEGAARAVLGTSASERAQILTLAHEALSLVKDDAEVDLGCADQVIRARRLICEILGKKLLEEKNLKARHELSSTMSDEADEALRLLALWEQRGFAGFRSFVVWFFHYGASLYGEHQPHFLIEFLEEWLSPAGFAAAATQTPAFQQIAVDALVRTRARVRETLFTNIGAESGPRWAQLLEELKSAEARWRVGVGGGGVITRNA